jgi:IS605 OrfB family transposase
MQRTIRILLKPSAQQAQALADVARMTTQAFNRCVTTGWQATVSNSTKLHHLTYYMVRAALPDLPSNLLVQARMKAAEALRSAFTLRKQGRKVTVPQSDACPPRYNERTYKLDWQSQTVRLSLVGGRQTIRFRVPDYARQYAFYPTDTADLIFRHGGWWLHVVVTVPTPHVAPTDQVVGVDLGLTRPAVTSNNRFLGKRRWKAIEGRLFHLKRALQKKGTRSANRHLQRVRHKQARFRRDADHVLSKQIVGATEPGATIVLENLKDIRKRMKAKRRTQTKRRMHSWSFAQLRRFIEYKAEERGCTVVGVDPRHTSQMCNRCGYIARNNRRSQSVFICRQCGYHLNADLNAARNIAAKYHAEWGTSPPSGLPVMQPIVSSDCDLIGTSPRLQPWGS